MRRETEMTSKLLTMEGLSYKLKSFDIPEYRIRTNRVGLEWLQKNLSTRNSNHPDFSLVKESIDFMLENKQYTS